MLLSLLFDMETLLIIDWIFLQRLLYAERYFSKKMNKLSATDLMEDPLLVATLQPDHIEDVALPEVPSLMKIISSVSPGPSIQAVTFSDHPIAINPVIHLMNSIDFLSQTSVCVDKEPTLIRNWFRRAGFNKSSFSLCWFHESSGQLVISSHFKVLWTQSDQLIHSQPTHFGRILPTGLQKSSYVLIGMYWCLELFEAASRRFFRTSWFRFEMWFRYEPYINDCVNTRRAVELTLLTTTSVSSSTRGWQIWTSIRQQCWPNTGDASPKNLQESHPPVHPLLSCARWFAPVIVVFYIR